MAGLQTDPTTAQKKKEMKRQRNQLFRSAANIIRFQAGANTPPTSRDNRNCGGHALLPPSEVGRHGAGPRCRGAPLGQPPRSSRRGPARPGVPLPSPTPFQRLHGAAQRGAGTPAPRSRSGPDCPLARREQPAGSDGRPSDPPDVTAPSAPLLSPFPLRSLRPASCRTGMKTSGSRSGKGGEEKEGSGNKTTAATRTSAAPPRDAHGRARPGPARPGAGTAPASPRTPRPRLPRSVTAILGVRHLAPPCPPPPS
ncbi:translation initiation factor IF-2-like [Pipra filicauda]|uniref:Translation initiation factor IF-2-like n=1 Tax=Pipra filicauda TaxID=649802 RepID=A0A7R5KDC3_9PASS|nr:translation initiation factor IF-2-like [Pipra filicauda]